MPHLVYVNFILKIESLFLKSFKNYQRRVNINYSLYGVHTTNKDNIIPNFQ